MLDAMAAGQPVATHHYSGGMTAGTVRNAELRDASAIARVHLEAWRETYTGIVPDSMLADEVYDSRLQLWTRILSMDPVPGQNVVAESGDQIVGFASAGEPFGPDAEHGHAFARSWHLYSIYLLASHHGSKLGQTMLDAVVGDRPTQLWVLQGNNRAIRFYERNGFAADGATDADPRAPGLVEVRMVR